MKKVGPVLRSNSTALQLKNLPPYRSGAAVKLLAMGLVTARDQLGVNSTSSCMTPALQIEYKDYLQVLGTRKKRRAGKKAKRKEKRKKKKAGKKGGLDVADDAVGTPGTTTLFKIKEKPFLSMDSFAAALGCLLDTAWTRSSSMRVSVEEDLAPANLGNLSHLPLSVKRDLISHLYQHASTSCGGNGEDSVFAKGSR